MTNLIRGEAIKMRSTRTAFGFLLTGVLLTVLFGLLSSLIDDPSSVQDRREAISVAPLFLLFVIFGVVGSTGEYRHRTVAPAVLIAPDRLRLLTARALAYAATGALVGLAMIVVSAAVTVPFMIGDGGESLAFGDYAWLVGGTVLLGALGSALGVGFGALVGNQVAGVVSVMAYLLVVDSLLGLLGDDWVPLILTVAALKVGGLEMDGDAFSFLGSLGVVAVWTAVFMGLGLLRESRREVT
jgi:hypothetical protein